MDKQEVFSYLDTSKVLDEVAKERARQDNKWGIQNHSPIEYCAILGEEVGEVQKAALEAHFGYPYDNSPYGEFPANSPQARKHHLDEYRKELIQVAAVAVAMVECYDRNKHLINQ